MATPIPPNFARFSLTELAQATSGTITSETTQHLVGVTTDSREAHAGSVFIALTGQQHDGHHHVQAAIDKGALAVVVSRHVDVPSGIGVVMVRDTLRALGDIAHAHRQRFSMPVIGITGSVGKTTTKELTYGALSALGLRVHRTAGNLNNLIGLPLTLLGMSDAHDAVVLEMGMNLRGEIARLAEIARPTIGVVTSVTEAHVEGVKDLAGVAREKGALLEALGEDAAAVFTKDDGILADYGARSPAQTKITFGISEGADVRLTEARIETNHTHCAYAVRGSNELVTIDLTMLGEGPARSGAAALAIVLALRGPESILDAVKGLVRVRPSPGRALPIAGWNDSLVLDDTYNASPRATELALHTAAELAAVRGGRAIAVLGDMKELGAESDRLHEEIGASAVAAGIELLVCCGAEMRAAARGALAAATIDGLRGIRIERIDDPMDAVLLVQEAVAPNDVVLVKGSRSMRMERVVEQLRKQDGEEAS
jgi:UDP-N-acetylmuramoyl-tripeptide--D-alanyl-D-alanine ligase